MRRYRRFGLIVPGLLLLYSAVFTTLAPGGRWQNHLFGFSMWQENDPGGWYLASAHELFWHPGTLVFAGHPGLPMQVLLAALQNTAYVLGGGPWISLSYTEFTARHISAIWWLSKLLATLTHLLSLYLLYKFARVAGVSPRAATLATASYGTSLPVLYYVSRVSVEPWMVVFFLLAFTGLWRYQDAVAGGARRRWTYLTWAAAAAVSGAFTKLQLLAPLPFICLALLLLPPGRAATGKPEPRSGRWRAAAVYVGAAAVTVLAYSLAMDWPAFIRLWVTAVELHRAQQPAATGYRALLAGMSHLGIIGSCELPLLTVGAAGLALWLLRRRSAIRLAWPALYALFTVVVWAYRNAGEGWLGFHYLFIFFAMLSIGFGCVADCAIARVSGLARREFGALVAFVLLLHGGSVWAAVDSRVQDVAMFRARHLAARYDVVSRLRHGERALLVGRPYPSFHGIQLAALREELEGLLVESSKLPIADRSPARLRSLGVRYVLDLNGSRPVLTPLDEWRGPACDREGLALETRHDDNRD